MYDWNKQTKNKLIRDIVTWRIWAIAFRLQNCRHKLHISAERTGVIHQRLTICIWNDGGGSDDSVGINQEVAQRQFAFETWLCYLSGLISSWPCLHVPTDVPQHLHKASQISLLVLGGIPHNCVLDLTIGFFYRLHYTARDLSSTV